MEADQKRSLLEWSNQRSFLCQRADHHIFDNCIGQPRSIFHVWGCYEFKSEDNTIWSIWWTKWKWSEWWTHFCQMISHYERKHWVPTLQVLTKFLQLHPWLIDFHLYNASKSNIDAFTDEFLSTRDDDNNRPVWFCPLIRPLAFLLDDL